VLASIVIGLSAHLTSFTLSFEGEAVVSALLAVATASLTLLTLPIMFVTYFYQICQSSTLCADTRLIADFLCKRAFTSMVSVELVWLSMYVS